jgi:hypothetical protein
MNDPDFTTIDLETMLGESLVPWQKQTLNNVYGGIKSGEMMTFSSGRQLGKSTFTADMLRKVIDDMSLAAPSFEVVDTAPVDGVCWYTVACNSQIGKWVREQDNTQWYEHGMTRSNFHNPRANFDVHVELFTMLKLTWGDV